MNMYKMYDVLEMVHKIMVVLKWAFRSSMIYKNV